MLLVIDVGNTNIVAGSVIERVGDKSYNTCFVIDRKEYGAFVF